MDILGWIAAIAAGLFACDQFFLWMERRGWLYWRKTKRKSSAAGDALLGLNIFDPGTRHLEDARVEHVLEDEDNGDDDSHRAPDDRVS